MRRGKPQSVTACKVGFRRIEIKNSKLLVNGVPVYIKGVNRHEHNDSLGHVQSRDIMMTDLKLMKQLNMNAVRTCHYPNHPLFYKLCHKYGFYVVSLNDPFLAMYIALAVASAPLMPSG